MPTATPIRAVDEFGATVAKYDSQLHAAANLGCCQRTVNYCLHSGIPYNGRWLRFVDRDNAPRRERCRRQPTHVTIGTDTYTSIRKAAKAMGLGVATLWDRIRKDPERYGVAAAY